jgi:hypothetical protein
MKTNQEKKKKQGKSKKGTRSTSQHNTQFGLST